MFKIKISNLPMIYPVPSILAGAVVDGKPNYMTLGNCGIISVRPAVICISSHKNNYTNIGIRDHGLFSVNIPSTDLLQKLDYCGLVTGAETDKSTMFGTFYGDDDRIPMAGECQVNMECKVVKTFDIHEMEVFIAEVTAVYADQACMTDGFPDTAKLKPICYCMDNLYWSIGNPVGVGFSEGRGFMEGNDIKGA